MSSIIQVCGNFHWAQAIVINTRPNGIQVVKAIEDCNFGFVFAPVLRTPKTLFLPRISEPAHIQDYEPLKHFSHQIKWNQIHFPALFRYVWTHQFGCTGHSSAPKFTDLHREPRMSTFASMSSYQRKLTDLHLEPSMSTYDMHVNSWT